ncbi:MerR family transcriptional regulator [Sphingorhabdus sp. SMR4y]|uniref:MerR family transcriptional regulator n=1 Tax=Sphingorhabdus sp. SMR4y TaxID=2584094 RepID=UPI000B5C35B2|nr:MerR family transcriptional regulator [Sphingorhabdus sp. SMR4y]ASK89367.1 HTH-type transcriptional repressor CarH [Sphingorhabdus sp. SMR4y]
MTKEQGAFRTIGELSKELGIKPHILRYWEDQFAVLNPLKRAGSRRHYRPEDVEIVKAINRLLNQEGYTIKGARKFLAAQRRGPEMVEDAPQHGAAPMSALTGKPGNDGPIIAELKSIRDRLSQALDHA